MSEDDDAIAVLQPTFLDNAPLLPYSSDVSVRRGKGAVRAEREELASEVGRVTQKQELSVPDKSTEEFDELAENVTVGLDDNITNTASISSMLGKKAHKIREQITEVNKRVKADLEEKSELMSDLAEAMRSKRRVDAIQTQMEKLQREAQSFQEKTTAVPGSDVNDVDSDDMDVDDLDSELVTRDRERWQLSLGPYSSTGRYADSPIPKCAFYDTEGDESDELDDDDDMDEDGAVVGGEENDVQMFEPEAVDEGTAPEN